MTRSSGNHRQKELPVLGTRQRPLVLVPPCVLAPNEQPDSSTSSRMEILTSSWILKSTLRFSQSSGGLFVDLISFGIDNHAIFVSCRLHGNTIIFDIPGNRF